jgi:hypothetical protein
MELVVLIIAVGSIVAFAIVIVASFLLKDHYTNWRERKETRQKAMISTEEPEPESFRPV